MAPATPALAATSRMLLASIHDVSPRTERETDQLAERLSALLGGPRFAMLVVPDHWGQAPLRDAPAFQQRLRAWSDMGIDMFVHGWFHRDDSTHSRLQQIKATTMTASEGEFLGLDRAAASARMADGKALIEDIIGRPAAGFIAPAWLYGPGAKTALADNGFAMAEDHLRVWEPASGRVLARGPVITWASRSRGRQLSSRGFAALARHALHPLDVVRIAVHPGDTTVPALLDSISATVTAFASRRPAGRYADLIRGAEAA